MDKRSNRLSTKTNPALKKLEKFIGDWDMQGSHPMLPAPVRGSSLIEWLEEDGILLWHFNFERPGPPSAIIVIGHDDAVETYSMLYFDERSVSRIYTMSLEGNTWKFWRESPGFSQRFTGIFSEDGSTISGHGELSRDGSKWEQDLDLTYTRVRR
jgi:hypothetical protein